MVESRNQQRDRSTAARLDAPSLAAPGFARRIVAWQRDHGRHDLPWQRSRDPYAIWVSEVMLQQTQVTAVIPYYLRFLERFPDIAALAAAPLDDVMRLWSGLGYYSRARNLHGAACVMSERHAAEFPRAVEDIAALPGIGRSTAAAIAALAFGERRAILDGNVKRVLCRYFGIEGDPATSAVERRLWSIAEALAPARDIEIYTQGLMDLGATVCIRRGAKCDACPVRPGCEALRSGRVDELPAPRVRKTLPERTTAMLLLLHKGEILLEKRPPTGIWGGLWSLPEAEIDADPASICRDRFGAEPRQCTPLPALNHGFTHFRLRIHPVRIDVARARKQSSEPGHIWLALDDARGAALPVPVRRILEQL